MRFCNIVWSLTSRPSQWLWAFGWNFFKLYSLSGPASCPPVSRCEAGGSDTEDQERPLGSDWSGSGSWLLGSGTMAQSTQTWGHGCPRMYPIIYSPWIIIYFCQIMEQTEHSSEENVLLSGVGSLKQMMSTGQSEGLFKARRERVCCMQCSVAYHFISLLYHSNNLFLKS